MHRVADLVADYLEGVEHCPVLPPIQPGALSAQLPTSPPHQAEPVEALLADYARLIEPNCTHWNHPGFLAYFSSSSSPPGILGEVLAAGINANAMLWRTAPAATELEVRVCDWMRQMIDLPSTFAGHLTDSASTSTFLALAAARNRDPALGIRQHGMAGRSDLPPLRVYASEQAHSSVDKALIALGLGLDSLRRITTDDAYQLDPEALQRAIATDRAAGARPLAVVATAGTTSTTSVDPLVAVSEICRREELWLHVDAAWAGSAAICPEYRALLAGIEAADSIVVNPHKWLFVPMGCSLLFVRDLTQLRNAFSLVPAYLETAERGEALDLMDLGLQLGRPFRALKLWMVIRAHGVEGLRTLIREHCRLGQAFATWVEAEPGFELMAPVPFSTVCFRATHGQSAEEADRFNARLLERVNRSGSVFLSQTVLRERYVLRLSVSNFRTQAAHVETAWRLIRTSAAALAAEDA